MSWLRVLAVVGCACTRSTAAPPPSPLSNATPSQLVPIDRVPVLVVQAVPGAKRDCRPSQVIRRRFGGHAVTPCTTSDCVERALADGQPFLVETDGQGTSSTIAYGLVGVVEDGELVTYTMTFDSDPCGGSCPDHGVTAIERCVRARRDVSNPEACALNVTRCFRCEREQLVVRCEFGR